MKICGNRSPEEVALAVDAGADAVGVVVASPRSRRNVTFAQAEGALAAAHGTLGVGVTASTDAATLAAIATMAGAVQCPASVHGQLLDRLRSHRPGVRLFLATPPAGVAEAARKIRQGDLIILDSIDATGYGGSGRRLDLVEAAALVRSTTARVLLAGGLTPENVAEALATVPAFGVDVASGVETDGIKDPRKVRAFIATARRAAADSAPAGGPLGKSHSPVRVAQEEEP
ncbi:MAG: phosphoribosylanthranilate isomerase [Thermoplasmatota archaeon]